MTPPVVFGRVRKQLMGKRMRVILARRLVKRVRNLLKTLNDEHIGRRWVGSETGLFRLLGRVGSENRDNMRKHSMEKAIG